MKFRLEFENGPHKGQRIVLERDRVAIGPGEGCDVRLPGDAEALGEILAVIERREDGMHLHVPEGREPVSVNGGPEVEEVLLTHGDRLSLAGIEILFTEIWEFKVPKGRRKPLIQRLATLLIVLVVVLQLALIAFQAGWVEVKLFETRKWVAENPEKAAELAANSRPSAEPAEEDTTTKPSQDVQGLFQLGGTGAEDAKKREARARLNKTTAEDSAKATTGEVVAADGAVQAEEDREKQEASVPEKAEKDAARKAKAEEELAHKEKAAEEDRQKAEAEKEKEAKALEKRKQEEAAEAAAKEDAAKKAALEDSKAETAGKKQTKPDSRAEETSRDTDAEQRAEELAEQKRKEETLRAKAEQDAEDARRAADKKASEERAKAAEEARKLEEEQLALEAERNKAAEAELSRILKMSLGGLLEQADVELSQLEANYPEFLPARIERAKLFEQRRLLQEAIHQWSLILQMPLDATLFKHAADERMRLTNLINDQNKEVTEPVPLRPSGPSEEKGPVNVMNTKVPETAPEPRVPSARPITPTVQRGLVRIVQVEREKFQSTAEYDEMRLFRIHLAPSGSRAPINSGDVRVIAAFFDKNLDTDEIYPAGVIVPDEPLVVFENWSGMARKQVSAAYFVPKGFRSDERRKSGGSGAFYGYVFQVYYKGELQHEEARPENLSTYFQQYRKRFPRP